MFYFLRTKTLFALSANETSGESLANDIKQEALELIEHLAQLCQIFQKNNMNKEEIDSEDIGDLFRNLHTLKGLSQMGGLLETVAMTHCVEDYVELIRSGKMKLESDVIELLQDVQYALDQIFKIYPDTIDADLVMDLERIQIEFEEKLKKINPPQEETIVENESLSVQNEDISVQEEENTAFNKFISRAENIYAVLFKNSEYKSCEELKSGTHADNISRVGDFILFRVNSIFYSDVFLFRF
ncbi:MAG: Hpt domain-containing protein [Bdellovibrionota bacterium]